MKHAIALALIVATTGCATSTRDLAPSYASPMMYQGYDCEQIAAESRRLQISIAEVGARVDQAAGNDAKLVGAALILWPTLFFLGGTKDKEAEYKTLKGQMVALQQASTEKRCSVLFREFNPPADPAPLEGGNVTQAKSEAP